MTTSYRPRLGDIKRTTGIAGQVSYRVGAYYPGDDGIPTDVEFVGSVYGGPVVMITRYGKTTEVQRFVDDPSRHGEFSPAWVRRFFGVER